MAVKRVEPGENAFLASLEAKAQQPNGFFRAMANRPDALKAFVPFYSAVMSPGSVERRTKALLYRAVSIANRCAFCIAANTPYARKAGITDEEMRALEAGEEGGFSAAEQAALSYARSLTRAGTASASERDNLERLFTSEQIVELTLVIAMSNFTNRFNNGLNILPEGQESSGS